MELSDEWGHDPKVQVWIELWRTQLLPMGWNGLFLNPVDCANPDNHRLGFVQDSRKPAFSHIG